MRHTTVALCGVTLACTLAMGGASLVDWRPAVVFILLGILCELLPVRLSALGSLSGDSTFAFVVNWAAAILWGPFIAIVAGAISVLSASMIGWQCSRLYFKLSGTINSRETEPSKLDVLMLRGLLALSHTWLERKDYPSWWIAQLILFNACLEGLVSSLSILCYMGAGGVLLGQPHAGFTFRNLIFPVCVGLAAYYFISTASFTVIGAIWEPGTSYRKTLGDFILRCRILMRQQVWLRFPNYAILGPFAIILAYLQTQVGCASIAVVVLPFYAMRDAFALTVEQVTLYRDTITTLGTYMQHYHPYTRGHLKRVAELSERLARELKLPTEVIMLMPDAGMLHDIGKVAVSEAILDKVTRLTDEEWERIKEHPVKGAEIVSHLEFLERIVDWVKYHHKWYNGSGYPDDGVKEVPIEAAIIAVADAFDAMTDDRELSLEWSCDTCGYKPGDGARLKVCPKCGAEKRRIYREPLSLDDAINELRRGAGTQFHPDVVRAFLRIMLDDKMEREKLSVESAA